METDLARRLLASENYTCVIVSAEGVLTSRERGILPLMKWIGSGADLRGAVAADRIVGRAAALLYAYMGVSELYAEVLGEGGQKVLRDHGIAHGYGTLAVRIVNRSGTDICPMEKAVAQISDPAEAFSALRKKMLEMGLLNA